MDKIIINGGCKLQGKVKIGGAKNAALPILIASLLTEEDCIVKNAPKLRDIETTMLVLSHIGKKIIQKNDDTFIVKDAHDININAPYRLVKLMRASSLVMGPLLARFGKFKVALPGGCAIGARPIDIHLKGFEQLGAKITLEEGYIKAESESLKPAHVTLDCPSVGATENLIMACVFIKGTTIIENAAKEPEVTDLINCLISMGAKIEGKGTGVLQITGVEKLKGINYNVIPDRIEAGTFMVAAAATRGKIELLNVKQDHLSIIISKLQETGVNVIVNKNSIIVDATNMDKIKPVSVETLPYPGFPTDMQAQWTAFMCIADGDSVITETVFENRFMHIAELKRMGASLNIKRNKVFIKGKKFLSGAQVMATDLRASAALIIAGLVAQDTTEVSRIYHIDRGYEKIERKLKDLGANVKRITEY